MKYILFVIRFGYALFPDTLPRCQVKFAMSIGQRELGLVIFAPSANIRCHALYYNVTADYGRCMSESAVVQKKSRMSTSGWKNLQHFCNISTKDLFKFKLNLLLTSSSKQLYYYYYYKDDYCTIIIIIIITIMQGLKSAGCTLALSVSHFPCPRGNYRE